MNKEKEEKIMKVLAYYFLLFITLTLSALTGIGTLVMFTFPIKERLFMSCLVSAYSFMVFYTLLDFTFKYLSLIKKLNKEKKK